jgi:hypothetical protein
MSTLPSPRGNRIRSYLPIALLLLLFAALVVPPILLGLHGTQQGLDQRDFHLPQVNAFVSQPFEFTHYHATAAQTPGHHILLAWIARSLGYRAVEADNLPIRFANAAFGFLVVLVTWYLYKSRAGNGWRAAVLALPLICSSYILFAAIWIETDDAALLFYELTVALASAVSSPLLPSIAVACMLVMWRQIYLPVTGLFGIAWLIRGPRLRSLPLPLLAVLLPCVLMGIYFIAWKGATPPVFQGVNGVGLHVATPLAALGLTAILLPFYLGYQYPSLLRLLRTRRIVAALLAIAVTALWLLGPSTYDREHGRWGGVVWILAQHTPSVGARSPLILCLAILGALVLCSFVTDAIERHETPYETLALLLYLLGYSLQIEAFQRYVESPLLFTYGYVACRATHPARSAWIGPVFLAACFSILSMLRAYDILPQILH